MIGSVSWQRVTAIPAAASAPAVARCDNLEGRLDRPRRPGRSRGRSAAGPGDPGHGDEREKCASSAQVTSIADASGLGLHAANQDER